MTEHTENGTLVRILTSFGVHSTQDDHGVRGIAVRFFTATTHLLPAAAVAVGVVAAAGSPHCKQNTPAGGMEEEGLTQLKETNVISRSNPAAAISSILVLLLFIPPPASPFFVLLHRSLLF